MNIFDEEKLTPEVREEHRKGQERLINAVVITAGIVALLSMLSPMFNFLIVWLVGFGGINFAFSHVKNDWLRWLLYITGQIPFIALLIWLHQAHPNGFDTGEPVDQP